MRFRTILNIRAILLVSIIGFATSIEDGKWYCTNDRMCAMTSNSQQLKNDIIFDSQNICALSCYEYGSLWPQPTIETNISHGRIYFDPDNLQYEILAPTNDCKNFLSENVEIFKSNIKKECRDSCNSNDEHRIEITLNADSDNLNLDWNTDESYKMLITTNGNRTNVEIKGATIYGARLGLETLSQLITSNIDHGLVMPNSAKVLDAPKYKHRGFLLDTARNYISLKKILQTIDGMATSKLNVFHWHATDSHSFPIESKRVPELQKLGAYSPKLIYSQDDMKLIVNYARIRGIRTLVEIDGPSHAGNGWQFGPAAGLDDLSLCINEKPYRNYCIQPPCGQLNPINSNVYKVLKNVFEDISDLTSNETIHMGGDEVHLGCWNSSQSLIDYLQKNGMDRSTTSFYKLWAYYHEQNLNSWDEITSGKNQSLKQVIVWSSHLTDPDIIEEYLPNDRYIIQTWVEGDKPLNKALLEKKYKLIISTKDAWYLDHGFWGVTKYYNWQKVYDNKLIKSSYVLGGEVCMWTEYVDEYALDTKVWPRTGAAAERLWSDPSKKAIASLGRFNRYRERLITRDLKPDAIIPKWCTLNEGQCL